MAKSDILVRWKADTQNYDSNIAKARRTLEGFVNDNISAGGAVKQLSSTIVRSVGSFASVTAVAGALSSALRNNIETARGFEKSMSQLSSLTGMTGDSLNRLKEYAIELGSTTTLSASQVADAFRMIGSQQPQLLASGEALKQVTKYAITLSEAAGIDLATASQTLSTSINQMGGDSSNAARYVNVLAAASQKGAGDIAWLGEALTKSATAAKAVGTDYEELVANLEQLAKAGFDASTAGTALRSIIMNLEKQANGEYKPSVVGLTKAFENLGAAHLTITEYQGIVGKMFATQAMSLANAAGEARNMTEAITGTNIAEQQAKTNTDNLDGALKSLSSAWEGLNLHLNGTNSMLTPLVRDLTRVISAVDTLAFSTDGLATKLTTLGGLIFRFGPGPIGKMLGLGIMTGAAPYAGVATNGSNSSYNPKAGTALHQALFMGTSQYGQIPTIKSTVTQSIADEANGAVKSIKQLQSELKNLKSLRDEAAEAGDYDLRDQYNEEIKSVQAQIKALRGVGGGKDKPEKLIEGGIPGLKEIDIETKGATESMRELQGALKYFKDQLMTAITAAEYQSATSGIASTERKIAAQPMALKFGMDAESMADIQEQMEAFGEELQSKIKPVTIKLTTEKAAEIAADGKDITSAWQAASGAIGKVGSAMESIQDPTAKVAGLIAKAIASVVAGAGQAISAKDTTSSGWAWIGAAAAIAAEMVTIVGTIHSITSKGYATGGIVDGRGGGFVTGNSFSGDNIGNVNLDAGELVLTRSQQGSLAAVLSGQQNSNSVGYARVNGEQIYIALQRYMRRAGHGEIVTFK